jgi:hypothetical protein
MNLKERIDTAGLRRLETSHTHQDSTATSTMSGLTHYYDTDTLRYFGAHVTYTQLSDHGVFFGTISTQRSGAGRTSGREYKVAIHDLTGHCLVSSDPGTLSTRRQANKALDLEWSGLDESTVLTDAIERRARELTRQLTALKKASQ